MSSWRASPGCSQNPPEIRRKGSPIQEQHRRFEPIAAHAADPAARAAASPIYLSTTFESDPDGEFSGGAYSRVNNPDRQALEEFLARLDEEPGLAVPLHLRPSLA